MNTAEKNFESLASNTYPGRGIVIGASPNGASMFQIYWIMGRSENSRNRIFIEEHGFVKTKAFDEAKMEDPSLIIYYPIKHINGFHIVTNGDQTDTLYNFIRDGKTFEQALAERTFEPDAPNFTPRISGIINPDYSFKLSIIKNAASGEPAPAHFFFNYATCGNGCGFCITTYAGDGSPLPSFEGEPYKLPVFATAEENLSRYWNGINDGNKISILVKEIKMDSGSFNIVIKNKLV